RVLQSARGHPGATLALCGAILEGETNRSRQAVTTAMLGSKMRSVHGHPHQEPSCRGMAKDGKPSLDLATLRAVPTGVWALGLVSLLMDISSEMIHALLPVYLVTALGMSTLAVGVIEGVAEATAAIIKVFSGALSDRLGRRKGLAVLGYGLA